jgi:hypothetical protein
MKSMVWMAGLLLLAGIFQRLLSALTGVCCLLSVFILLDTMKRVFRVLMTSFLLYTDDIYRGYPVLWFTDHSFFLSIPVTFFFV